MLQKALIPKTQSAGPFSEAEVSFHFLCKHMLISSEMLLIIRARLCLKGWSQVAPLRSAVFGT